MISQSLPLMKLILTQKLGRNLGGSCPLGAPVAPPLTTEYNIYQSIKLAANKVQISEELDQNDHKNDIKL